MDNNILPATLDMTKLPNWVHWLAQDADGRWWGYEVEPHQHHNGWYENEIGRNILLQQEGASKEWRDRLIQIK